MEQNEISEKNLLHGKWTLDDDDDDDDIVPVFIW